MKKFFTVLIFVAFSTTVSAADILLSGENNRLNLYGTIRAHAWFQNADVNGSSNPNSSSLEFVTQPNSRIGFNLTAGNIFGTAEIGYGQDSGAWGASNNVSTFRLLSAGYMFSNGLSISIGRQSTIAETQVEYDNLYAIDNGMSGFGTMQIHRTFMIKLSVMNIELAIVSNGYIAGNFTGDNLTGVIKVDGINQSKNADISVANGLLPSFEVAYNLKYDYLSGKIFGNYTGISTNAKVVGFSETQRELVNVFTAGAVLKGKVNSVTAVLSGFYAYNGTLNGKVRWGAAGTAPFTGLSFNDISSTDLAGGKVADIYAGFKQNNAFGIALSVGYDIAPNFVITVGGGYQRIWSPSYKGGKNDSENFSYDAFACYIVAPYKLSQNFYIIPTIGYYENFTNGKLDNSGKATDTSKAVLIAGAQLRFNF